jgi:hypothetical protein
MLQKLQILRVFMNLALLKKIIIFFMVAIWLVLMFNIFKSGGSMNSQLPKCIFTTMITFGILTIIVKAIDKKMGVK